MKQEELLKYLEKKILKISKESPLLIGIDGISAAGKTTLADELANTLEKSGRQIIRASIDGFHNPKDIRYQKGKDSYQGYYYDSFNNDAVINVLLKPLIKGNLKYKTAVFNYTIDSEVETPIQTAAKNAILIMEGVFLFRPELVKYWNLKIFIDVNFDTNLQRATKRTTDLNYLGKKETIIKKYNQRYIPGEKLYFKEASPKEHADIIIDNNDFKNPKIIKE